MISNDDAQHVIGSTAYGRDEEKIGKVGQLFLDDQTGEPQFATVNTGFFGTNESFVPVTDARLEGDRLVVPFDKDVVKGAPNVDVDAGHLDESDEARLFEYYGIAHQSGGTNGTAGTGQGTGHDATGTHDDPGTGLGTTSSEREDAESWRQEWDRAGGAEGHASRVEGDSSSVGGRTAGVGQATGTEGHDTSGPTTDDAMTVSEERLDVGTERRQTGRARLRKYVTTEMETRTVPVRKEHAVVETEPITDGNADRAHDGPAISEDEHEVVLEEETPAVSTHAEPVERVRLGTETTTDEEQVTEEVRKEHVDVEGDVEDRRDR